MRALAERDALGSMAYFAKSEASVLGSSAMRARAQGVGDRGILCPRTRAAPEFVITMTSAIRNATRGFRIHKDLPPFTLHTSLGNLFGSNSNPDSLILQCFHLRYSPPSLQMLPAPLLSPSPTVPTTFFVTSSPTVPGAA